MQFKHFIGIDLSKKTFYAALFQAPAQYDVEEFKNSNEGISAFINFLVERGSSPEESLICTEHCGVYLDRLVRVLHAEGYFLWVNSPTVLKRFSPDLNRLKTDKTDAKKLCQYAIAFQEKAQQFIPDSPREAQLKSLYRLRKQLIKHRVALENQCQSNEQLVSPCIESRKVYQEVIATINKQLKDVEKELKSLILKEPETKRSYEILTSIPGVGPVIALKMILSTSNFTRIRTAKAFACFIATAPFEKSSGEYYRSPRVSKMGALDIKKLFYMGALRQTQPGQFFKQRYDYEVIKLKKHHNSVINALMNELIRIAYILINRNQLFDPNTYLIGKKNPHKYLTMS